jgi:hypothetical protein
VNQISLKGPQTRFIAFGGDRDGVRYFSRRGWRNFARATDLSVCLGVHRRLEDSWQFAVLSSRLSEAGCRLLRTACGLLLFACLAYFAVEQQLSVYSDRRRSFVLRLPSSATLASKKQ